MGRKIIFKKKELDGTSKIRSWKVEILALQSNSSRRRIGIHEKNFNEDESDEESGGMGDDCNREE